MYPLPPSYTPRRMQPPPVLPPTLSEEARALFDEIFNTTDGILRFAPPPGAIHRNVFQAAQTLMALLSGLPRDLGDAVADAGRGPHARRLNPAERALVVKIHGMVVNPDDVRIVRGPGYSPLAKAAFLHGNPAITIGNTIYINYHYYDLTPRDLTSSEDGINMLAHEYMHVTQYKRFGYGNFTRRYVADLDANNYDPEKTYAYQNRKLDFAHEPLEGQAQIVGDYTSDRLSANPAHRAQAKLLQPRLRGTGIYGY